MGREAYAEASVVYGVSIRLPYDVCWSKCLKRLKQLAQMDEETRANGEEPKHKVAKMTKKPLFTYEDKEKEEDEKEEKEKKEEEEQEEEEEEEGNPVNYLEDKREDFDSASNAVLDKVLGPGHGLVMKFYIGHDYSESVIKLMLHLDNDNHSSINSFEGVSIEPIQFQETKDADTKMNQVLEFLGVEVDEGSKIGWNLVNCCLLYE